MDHKKTTTPLDFLPHKSHRDLYFPVTVQFIFKVKKTNEQRVE